jgi:hypothetical protein
MIEQRVDELGLKVPSDAHVLACLLTISDPVVRRDAIKEALGVDIDDVPGARTHSQEDH